MLFALVGLGWVWGFVALFNVGNFGEPIVFAIDGAHVIDDGFQVQFVAFIFIWHGLNIKIKIAIFYICTKLMGVL